MFTCAMPRDLDAFGKIVGVDQHIFGKSTVSRPASTAIFIKRPEIYSALFAPDGSIAGYLDLYPLRPQWAKRFIDGDISEADFDASMILERSESHERCFFYVGSIVVEGRFDPLLRSLMIASLFKWHARHVAALVTRQASLIMTTATAQGARLARIIGARKLCDGSQRKDGLDMVGRAITPAAIRHLHVVFGGFDSEGVIHLDFDR
jgi:hypothetical protein